MVSRPFLCFRDQRASPGPAVQKVSRVFEFQHLRPWSLASVSTRDISSEREIGARARPFESGPDSLVRHSNLSFVGRDFRVLRMHLASPLHRTEHREQASRQLGLGLIPAPTVSVPVGAPCTVAAVRTSEKYLAQSSSRSRQVFSSIFRVLVANLRSHLAGFVRRCAGRLNAESGESAPGGRRLHLSASHGRKRPSATAWRETASASCLLSAIYGLPQRYVPAKTTPSRRAKFKLRVLHGRSQRRHLGRFEGGASG